MIFFKIISFIVLTVNIMKLPKLYKKKYSNICHIILLLILEDMIYFIQLRQ